MSLVERDVPPLPRDALLGAGVHPVLARLLAARGIAGNDELDTDLKHLLAPSGLRGIDAASRLLANAIDARQPIVVVADYDCDGATACAVALRGLRAMGAVVDYLVPNRFDHGYGLTPGIVDLAACHPRLGKPSLIVTVDNGIASLDGVDRANALGIQVLVTDHHLPGDSLPRAAAIVNPNQPGCSFASKNLAGVGVMFYVLLALRSLLRERGHFRDRPQPALQNLLDLVALGTVADLVRLDRNNRLLVAAGLRRIRASRACPGIAALLAIARRDPARATCEDLGFTAGPRINAAGRLEDIAIGVECLLADDPVRGREIAAQLDSINRERRQIEGDMREQALTTVGDPDPARRSLIVFGDDWHEGVVGLIASRLKELHHRPTVAFAPSTADSSILRGSGRSIAGVHLRDTLDLVSKRHPTMIDRFGGHAMAAGLSMRAQGLAEFTRAFEQAVLDSADPSCFERTLATDGPLQAGELDLSLVEELDRCVWGQGFPAPLFCDVVDVTSQRLVKDKHLKLELKVRGRKIDAMAFGRADPLPARTRIAYRVSRNEWNGLASLQLLVDAVEEPDTGRA